MQGLRVLHSIICLLLLVLHEMLHIKFTLGVVILDLFAQFLLKHEFYEKFFVHAKVLVGRRNLVSLRVHVLMLDA